MITLAPRPRAAAKKSTVALDQIDFPANARPTHADKVRELANSIRRLGLQTLPTVVERDGRYMLIAGRHRVEALRVIGRDPIDVRVVDFDDIEARLWTISENLHRNELAPLQRAEHIAAWIRLTEANGVSSQVETKLSSRGRDGEGRPESGVNAAARELGVSKSEAHRAVKIDSITPEAKEAAREAGLDRNQSALLEAAKEHTPEEQTATIWRLAESKAISEGKNRAAPVPPLRDLVGISGGELARWIKITTPNDRRHVIRVLEMAAAILRDEIEKA